MRPTVVMGGDGLIGEAYLAQARAQGLDLPWTSRRPIQIRAGAVALDLERPGALPWRAWKRAGCGHVLIGAAMTSLAACEREPARSMRLNYIRPLQLAQAALEQGLTPILFSTDYVFDGRVGGYREDDAVHPLNVYGRHKAALDAAALKLSRVMVLRLAKVWTACLDDGGLLASIAGPLGRGETVRAAADMVFSPVRLEELLTAITRLQAQDFHGLIHIGGREVWTRWELALALARRLQLPETNLIRIELADLGEPFERPRRTDLDSSLLQTLTDLPCQPLSAWLASL
ncbi:MAG: NAD(P)-dependent oxidoreductase [Candidatus Sericytochromatia bacterium]